MTTTATTSVPIKPISEPYVIARINVTSAPPHYSKVAPFVCWGIYNQKTRKLLQRPAPGTLSHAVENLFDCLGGCSKRAFHYQDAVFSLLVIDVVATGSSECNITSYDVKGSYGTLVISYDEFIKEQKANNLCMDIANIEDRCGWAIDMTEQEAPAQTDLVNDLKLSLYALRVAKEEAQRYRNEVSLEQFITKEKKQ